MNLLKVWWVHVVRQKNWTFSDAKSLRNLSSSNGSHMQENITILVPVFTWFTSSSSCIMSNIIGSWYILMTKRRKKPTSRILWSTPWWFCAWYTHVCTIWHNYSTKVSSTTSLTNGTLSTSFISGVESLPTRCKWQRMKQRSTIFSYSKTWC